MPNLEVARQKAERIVGAIDKRIDAVRAELCRVAGIGPERFDYCTQEGMAAACNAFHDARRDFAGYDGMERALFLRRADAHDVLALIVTKQMRATERREQREFKREYEAGRHACPTCGLAA